MENKEPLIRCSCCKTYMLHTHFPVRVKTGLRYRTCNACRLPRFECDICNTKFTQNYSLQTHIDGVHNKLKPFKCEFCDSKFTRNYSLQTHIDGVHNNLTPYMCNLCDSKFTTNGNLKKHTKICSGDLNVSGGELAVMKALELLNIEYEAEISEVKNNDNGNWLRFDFKIYIGDIVAYIEYDGKQHFKPCRFGGMSHEKSLSNFEKIQLHDKLKDYWCIENKFELLRIPYYQFENIHYIIKTFIYELTHQYS